MKTHRKTIVDYFKKNISKGYPIDSLKWALVKQGYTRTDIEAAMEDAKNELADAERKAESAKPKIDYEAYDKDDKILTPKKPWWKKIFGA